MDAVLQSQHRIARSDTVFAVYLRTYVLGFPRGRRISDSGRFFLVFPVRFVNNRCMPDKSKKDSVFQVVCPCCEAVVWVDGESRCVIKSEKAAKKKSTLDDLLLKEKKRSEGIDHKLEATFELQKKKLEDAKKKFANALSKTDGD